MSEIPKTPGMQKREAKEAISACKSNIKELLIQFRRVSQSVRRAERTAKAAEERVFAKPTDKNKMRDVEAYENYYYLGDEYRRTLEKIKINLHHIDNEYDSLIEAYISRGKDIERIMNEKEAYRARIEEKILKADRSLGTVPPVSEHGASEESPALVDESREAPLVKVAPVTIDVTPMVEKAVNAAIERLSVTLGERLEKYARELVLPTECERTDSQPDASVHKIDTDAENEKIANELKRIAADLESLRERYSENEKRQRELLDEERELLLEIKRLSRGKSPKLKSVKKK